MLILSCVFNFRLFEAERQQNEKRREFFKKSTRSSAKDFEMNHFWNYEEIMEYVDQVAIDYSDIVAVHKLKDSFQGRRIVNIEITATGDKSDRPIILIDSTIHAR